MLTYVDNENYKYLKPSNQLLPPLHLYKSQKAAMKRCLSWDKIDTKKKSKLLNLNVRQQVDFDSNVVG